MNYVIIIDITKDGGIVMLDPAILKELKQTNVGKDAEKTKERLRGIWRDLEKPQRDEIMQFAEFTKYTVERSYKNGNISAKLALAMAHVLKINPNFLIGASDERGEYSDEVVRQFLIDTGNGKLLDRNAKPKRAYNRKKIVDADVLDESVEESLEESVADSAITSDDSTATDEINTESLESEMVPAFEVSTNTESLEPEIIPAFETPTTPYDKLLSRIQDRVRTITESEQEKLDSMPNDTAEQLLKGLYLRNEYSEEAKRLTSLLKIILTL